MIRGDGDHGNRDTPAGSFSPPVAIEPTTPPALGGERVHASG
jgi:hypothetical protein